MEVAFVFVGARLRFSRLFSVLCRSWYAHRLLLAPKTAPARRTRAEPASHEGLPATPPQFCPRSHESTSPGDAVSAQSA